VQWHHYQLGSRLKLTGFSRGVSSLPCTASGKQPTLHIIHATEMNAPKPTDPICPVTVPVSTAGSRSRLRLMFASCRVPNEGHCGWMYLEGRAVSAYQSRPIGLVLNDKACINQIIRKSFFMRSSYSSTCNRTVPVPSIVWNDCV